LAVLTILLIGVLALSFNVQPVKAWAGTVYIRADGSIDPPDAPIITYDNVTYTLTDNITSSADGIVVERDNIVINGAGYTIQGINPPPHSNGTGISLPERSNVIIRNINIKHFKHGISLSYSSNISILGNNITANYHFGIFLKHSSNNSISRNNIMNTYNNGIGIYSSSNNNKIIENNMTRNYLNIHSVTSSNNTISDNNLSNSLISVSLYSFSNDNKISGNDVSSNHEGIVLDDHCLSNSISGNKITGNDNGIRLCYGSAYNSIAENKITNNNNGILLDLSSNNIVSGNKITSNGYGIRFDKSYNNFIYHNNFINNTQQVQIETCDCANVWDNGYPSGGNYWSDYNGTDFYSGPYQNETGSDGIGDAPYVIDVDNRDNYPLTEPWKRPIEWWPMFQHDPQHTGHTTEDGPDTNETLWTFQTGDWVVSSPAVVDDRVFVGSWDWYFYCLDYICGRVLWKINIGGWPYSSSPVVVDGVVYAGSTTEYSSKVFALNATTGSIIWVRNFDFQQRSNLNFYKGILYVGSRGGLFALNATTGNTIWFSPEGFQLWGSPAINKDVIYIPHRFNLTARNATTGSLLWTKEIAWGFYKDEKSPTVAYGMVFTVVHDKTGDKTLALNATNGEIIWSSIPGSEESTPAVSGGKLFITRRGSPGIFALNATTGEVIWNSTSCSDVASSPAIAGGKVFVGSLNGKIYVLNETNGEICWIYQAGDGFWGSSPAIVDGKLYIGSMDGKIYAIGEQYPPTANFTWTPLYPMVGEVVTFNASTSAPNGGTIVKYEWDFGDGENATGEVVTHTYLLAGNYTVTLNVTDCEGLLDIEQKTIEVKPLPSFNLTIETSTGGTTDPPPGTYSYTANSSVQVTAIAEAGYLFDYWELDSVNVGSANPYTVLMDMDHTLKAVFELIPPPLSVSISPLSASILMSESLAFSSTVTGGTTPYSYQWYLNGSAVSGATLDSWIFTPTSVGVYEVYLNVTDNSGNIAISQTATVSVAPQITVSISPMSMAVIVGEPITFTSTTSGGYPPYTYQWFFNGAPVSGATSDTWTFTPTESGIFYVYLKVTDDEGNTAQSDAARITVAAVPVGGYSIPIQTTATAKPLTPYLILTAILTIAFTTVKRKTTNKTKKPP